MTDQTTETTEAPAETETTPLELNVKELKGNLVTTAQLLKLYYKFSDAEDRHTIDLGMDLMLTASLHTALEVMTAPEFKDLDVKERSGLASGLFTQAVNLAGLYDMVTGSTRQRMILTLVKAKFGDALTIVDRNEPAAKGEPDAADTD